MTTGTLKPLGFVLTTVSLLWIPMAQAAPPMITGFKLIGPDSSLNIQNEPGAGTQIQFCTNLMLNSWTVLTNFAMAESNYFFVDAGRPASSQRFYRLLAFSPNVPVGMKLVPGGSFLMGDTFNEGDPGELPAHTVYVSAFYMETKLVTGDVWNTVYQWSTNHAYSLWTPNYAKAPTYAHPVLTGPDNAVRWCNARSEMEGLTPCYYKDPAQTIVSRDPYDAISNACVKWTANGYRLPTEAEWEKAARGGMNGKRFPWGDIITHAYANYYSTNLYAYDVSSTRGFHPTFQDGDSVGVFTSPVTHFNPNGFGLYDMCGNVRQCCWDVYSDTYYNSSPAADPHGPDGDSPSRVGRSTSWGSPGSGLFAVDARRGRCSARSPILAPPGFEPAVPGFRCVRRF
ncbi:MAG TPA: SUMF1/EgtB/PvdO family nonheme iron enzyme [Candidatus Dormibacteraeota bacterium]|nr:SUMF1/EgtB/PvdO family nonheme iron enzyme [Candidatus Dormibacteraeota bacterium]